MKTIGQNQNPAIRQPLTRRNNRSTLKTANIKEELIRSLQKENLHLRRSSVSLAHDLKNHIQSILFTIESCNKTDIQNNLYDRIIQQTQAMKNTVGMIMEYSSPYQRKLTTEPVLIIHETAAAWKDQLHMQLFGEEISYSLKIHPTAFRQIMVNLIGNSVKHSGINPVCVSISMKRIADQIEFNYSDNGAGLPAEIIDNLDNLTPAENPGVESGTGLWLIREWISEAGGTMSFRDGKICFVIPLEIPEGYRQSF